MIKFTDIIPGGPWAQEETVQEQSNPGLSGYGTLSPCRSTGLLYQQVLTPQVPPETEMGSWLGKPLSSLAESWEATKLKAAFIHQDITLHDFCFPWLRLSLLQSRSKQRFLFLYFTTNLIQAWMLSLFMNWPSLLLLVCKKPDLPQVYKLMLLSGSAQAPELFILLPLVRVSLR